nr:PREDICTED: probable multidrug resistance-associated protein lethal(2)03659 [Bemisia tabaci]
MDGGKKKLERPPHPRATANPLSALTFTWILDLFLKGRRRDLETEDLYITLKEHSSGYLGDRLERLWLQEVTNSKKLKRKPSLLRALVKCFGAKLMLYGLLLCTMEICLRVPQPILLGGLISYFTQRSQMSFTSALCLCAALIFLIFVCALCGEHPYFMAAVHMGMKLRVACCSLVHRKALRLSKTALGETTAGQIVNLLSNDVNRFDVAIVFVHYLWIGPLETIVVTYFLWTEVGVSSIIGVFVLLMFIPLQGWLGKKTSSLRLRTAIKTDERVRLMNEIISGIQVIKMYTWEKPFAKLVAFARKREIKMIKGSAYIRAVLLSFIVFHTRIALFYAIFSYVMFGNTITAQKVFVLTSYFNILRQTMTVFFPQGIGQVAEALVSIRRLQNFLLYEEMDIKHLPSSKANGSAVDETDNNALKNSDKNEIITDKTRSNQINDLKNGAATVLADVNENSIVIKGAKAKWFEHSTDYSLNNINLKIKKGKLLAIVGPVGSGKTSLLHAILRELPLLEGSIVTNGIISYASQEPWLFAGSVRQNILFGLPMERDWYKKVVKTCALQTDFDQFPYGDKTVVGERGVSLSGGQRARINLARAIYKRADVYLLDDPLSAVDAHVGKHLFEDCISLALKDKTVILVTHQLQYLSNVDHVIMMQNGTIEAEGTYQELQSSSGKNYLSLLSSVKEEEEKEDNLTISVSTLHKRQSSVQSVASSLDDRYEEDPQEVEEMRTTGQVSGQVYTKYFRAGGHLCFVFFLLFMCVLTQILASGSDYWITYWVNLEEHEWAPTLNKTSHLSAPHNDTVNLPSLDLEGNPLSQNGTQADNSHMTHNFFGFPLDRQWCIYIFSAITAAMVIATLVRSASFVQLCTNASMNLHNNMFSAIVRSTMYFFNSNPSGRILNRFSKDMGSIDELLPLALIDCIQIGLTLVGIIIVVATVNPLLLIPTTVIGIIFYLLRIFYISTSRSVKRLEGITRSPVFSHLNASLQGLTTIRAFGAQSILEQEFDNHQDLHSSAWYLFIASSRAFGFWLDVVCLFYIAIVTFSFLVLGNENYGGNVGLAITQSIGLTGMFQWGMRQSAELENQMTSVERVLEYSNLPQEPALESPPNSDKKPPPDWPQRGRVIFRKMFLRYVAHEPPVLKNLNFTIEPKEKVGIVGRTGAGKSSLISALFRLAYNEGQIIIDDIDVGEIGIHELRSKISIIPQEPVIFSGTLRRNLDPFDEYPDAKIWNALDEVELKDFVSDLAGGLNTKMSEGGTNFSVGQRQLVCLARAIVRNNKILVMDEATANVDPQTDVLIQSTIRNKFKDCTVLTIAHRLHTVMDSSKVLVMDGGTMVEFDHPWLLLQNKESFFYKMVEKTGKNSSQMLMSIAAKNYENLRSHNIEKDLQSLSYIDESTELGNRQFSDESSTSDLRNHQK